MRQDIPKGAIELHVSQLKLGMFVTALDKSWLETPFLVQGILIQSQEDIDKISEQSTFVWIDPHKQSIQLMGKLKKISAQSSNSLQTKKRTIEKSSESLHLKKQVKHYSKSEEVEREHSTAYKVFSDGKVVIKEVLAAAVQNVTPDQDKSKNLVKSCLDSILRNPDALLWMTKIREEDEYTAEHCLSVCVLAIVFGRYLGLKEKDLTLLGMCGLLHDVGKMRVSAELLNKPGALTADEFSEIKNHTLRGYELLSSNDKPLPSIIAETAVGHHERMDLRGYPKKISASTLPELVRIISIVDAYDAMTADRCYSAAKSTTTALKIIYEERGKQFDEDLALAFIRCIGIYPPGSLVELMNGSVGIVLDVNEKYRHLPRIIILRDADNKVFSPYIVNLIEIEFGDLDSGYLVKATLKSGAHGIDVKNYTRHSES